MSEAARIRSTFMGIIGADARRQSGMPVCERDGVHLWELKPGRMARCVECHRWRQLTRQEKEAHCDGQRWEEEAT